MRRLQRLRGPASALPTCSAPSVRTSPAAGLLKSELVASSSQTHNLASRRTHLWQSNLSTQRRCLSTSASRLEKQTALETHEPVEEEVPAEYGIQTDLVYPAEIQQAVRSDDVTDPTYSPATNADGLEEVGGLDGWWDNPEHWGPSKNYSGFGPVDKVTDPAVLEVLTKQAVVEAITVVALTKDIAEATNMMVDLEGEDQATVANTEIIAGPMGTAWFRDKKTLEGIQMLLKRAGQTQTETSGPYIPSPEEAKEMIKSWGSGWKATRIEDPFVKFYTTKRIQKLTGHVIPDGKLVGVDTIGALVARIVKPPKAKKLVEDIKAKGDLLELPNVHVYPRRITPVDKQNMVGRWKIIERELQKRGLPVLGTGGYRKTREKIWIRGAKTSKMASTVKEISDLMSRVLGTPSDSSDALLGQKSWRADQLKQALTVAQKAWLDGSHDSLALVAEKVADAARDPSWRLPVGDSGLLGFFLSTVISAEGLELPLKKQSLRLIGNACAECDENKARVVESGKLGTSLIGLLEDDDSLLPFAVSVIYNICVEFEEAQLQACEAALSKKLVDIISGPRLLQCQQSLGIIIQLFEQLVSQALEPKVASLSTPAILLSLATSRTNEPDLEDFTGICTVALAYLTYEQFQVAFVDSGSVSVLQQAFYDSYTRFDIANADPDTAEQLKQVWNAAVTILADISALPGFAEKYPLDSPVVQRFVAWLSSPASYSHLQTAACLSLGNLSRSDSASLTLAQTVVNPLLAILSRAIPTTSAQTQPPISERPPAQLLHAVLGFLKNLAIPQPNKPTLSTALLSPLNSILPSLWTTTTAQPQVQFATVSLTRLLLVNNPPAVTLLCAPLPPSSSPHTTRDGPALSNLHILMDIALRADADPTKMEAARAVCAVARVLQAPAHKDLLSADWNWGSPEDTSAEDTARARFYSAHAAPITKTLTNQLTHKKFPALRSEALFVLALLARSEDGGKLAVRVLEESTEACRALVQAVTGREATDEELGVAGEARVVEVVEETEKAKESAAAVNTGLVDGLGLEPQQADVKQTAGMTKIDRENGLVLVAEIIRGFLDELSPARKGVLENLLREGGELILEERKKGQEA
ncbi:hypothetical protein B0T16DRAFT_447920 [Cercophora newfieldiana]|uniref:Large ribosomal subunit protein mL50 n=1 Tax=Cercophora newfieldiana TaxID=92897 RepID=A0AA40CMA0_9PEZI|nr:hypothetical protein B0T16DRAFT_447920 [Cercophora newfieldiana]